ncbi:MAG: PrgI family protein, partial [Clostridia bacterium]|nr:PrgI family protein [Clostridia bacterium]
SLRQLIFSCIAVTSAVFVYFGLRPYLGADILSWLCVAAAVPFAVYSIS